MESYISNFKEDGWTISNYEQAVQTWISDFLYGKDLPREYGDLIRDVLKSETSDSNGEPPLLLHADFDNLRMRNINYFARILPVFTMLFREVFADICMVSLLDLDADTYLDAFYDDICGKPTSAEFYAVRIFTTLTTVGKTVPRRHGAVNTEAEDQFFSVLKRLSRQNSEEDKKQATYQFPLGCIRRLQMYSEGCGEKVKELLSAEDVKRLRRMYQNAINPNMEHQELQRFIQEYRKKYLGVDLS